MEAGKYVFFVKESLNKGLVGNNNIVFTTLRECWENEGFHNFTEEYLNELEPIAEDIGLTYIGDGMFECRVIMPADELSELLIEKGFVEDSAYSEFVKENLVSDIYDDFEDDVDCDPYEDNYSSYDDNEDGF
jgi:hypothetical protein